MKEFLKWMAGGVGGLLLALVQAYQAGGMSIKAIGTVLLGAVLYRAGSWLVAKFGPQLPATT